MNRMSLVLGLTLSVSMIGCQSQTGPSGPVAQESPAAPPAARTIRSHPFVTQWTIPGSVSTHNYCSLAVDSAGNVYMADVTANRIIKYDPNGVQLLQWGSTGSANGQFLDPYSIAVDTRTNEVYVADSGNHRIQRFNSNGTFLSTFGSKGNGIGQLFWPEGIGVVNHVLANGTNQFFIFVADSFNNRIVKYNSSGTVLAVWGSAGSGFGQLNTPRGNIGITDQGINYSIWVSDTNNNRIVLIASNGSFNATYGTLGSGQGQLNLPFGVAGTGLEFGHIWTADWRNARIQEFEISDWGTLSPAGSNPPSFPPTGMALGIATNGTYIYVADPDNHRIIKFKF